MTANECGEGDLQQFIGVAARRSKRTADETNALVESAHQLSLSDLCKGEAATVF